VPAYTVIGGLLLAATIPFLAPAAVAAGATHESARTLAAGPPTVVVVSSAPGRDLAAAGTVSTEGARWTRPDGGTTTTSLTLLPRRTTESIVEREAPSALQQRAPTLAAAPAAPAAPTEPAVAPRRGQDASADPIARARPMPYVETRLGTAVPARIRAYETTIQRAAREYNVDPNFVAAVIMTESSGDPNAVSPKNAIGLMQLLDGPRDPEQNIAEGTRTLARWLKYFGQVDLALAAYNAGPGNVLKHGGVPPFPETHSHISRTLTRYAAYSASATTA
jgi:soluble lytic murein transglycosylase-like protein